MFVKEAVEKLDFFKTLNNKQIDDLIDISSVELYNENTILYYEKSETSKIIFLIDGLAKAYKIDKYDNDIFLYYIYKNSLLSEISNIYQDELIFFSNISFIQPSVILSIDYKKFKELFIYTNILTLQFTNEIIIKSKNLQSLINREFIFDAVAKVAMMLGSDLTMFNQLKRHDISLMLHIQPSTLSRVLNRLKRDNIIDIHHGKVSILDKNNLDIIYKGV